MKKILVIDDNKDILEAIKFTLVTNGYEVDTSDNWEYIEHLYKKDRPVPDLIILDVLLSGIDGKTLCRDLKKNEKTKNIPVILISAHPSANQYLESVGADGFLAKPFNISDLLDTVDSKMLSAN